MKIRDAVSDDARMLFDWANETEVRKHAFSSKPLEWESHKQWFETRLSDSDSKIYIALSDEGEALGQIRFDRIDTATAEVDVHTKSGLRGKGVGSQIIALATEHVLQQTDISEVYAVVKLENVKSRRAFEKAGFTLLDKIIVQGCPCYRFSTAV